MALKYTCKYWVGNHDSCHPRFIFNAKRKKSDSKKEKYTNITFETMPILFYFYQHQYYSPCDLSLNIRYVVIFYTVYK